MAKRLLLTIGLAFGLVVAASPAGAQQYPPEPFFLTVSDTTVLPGQTITVTGHETPGSTAITLTFFSVAQALGTLTPEADGDFTGPVTIPRDATLGNHTITAVDTAGVEVSASVTVVGTDEAAADDDAAAAAGALPRTGDDTSLPLLRVGAVLLAAGGLLLFLTRRRRGTDAEEQATAAV